MTRGGEEPATTARGNKITIMLIASGHPLLLLPAAHGMPTPLHHLHGRSGRQTNGSLGRSRQHLQLPDVLKLGRQLRPILSPEPKVPGGPSSRYSVPVRGTPEAPLNSMYYPSTTVATWTRIAQGAPSSRRLSNTRSGKPNSSPKGSDLDLKTQSSPWQSGLRVRTVFLQVPTQSATKVVYDDDDSMAEEMRGRNGCGRYKKIIHQPMATLETVHGHG
ncbi:hypothetical protein JTE90_022931 [Oedothorax gibbosus]|uniref:Uncharacterized protein n=1 Tax=Oedothorax gibbosus TaxID=931172 RepID=A0AAV6TKV8_9ARAC|nr:hypothetical protein JTE90_022931 [Oedothorax gibbosus]